MKKLFITFCILLTVTYITGCAECQISENVQFKNPLFYERMEPSNEGPSLILTPHHMIIDMENSGIAEGSCELLENEPNYIVHLCTVYYSILNESQTYKYKYSIDPNSCRKVSDVDTETSAENDILECSVCKFIYDIQTGNSDGWTWYTVQHKK